MRQRMNGMKLGIVLMIVGTTTDPALIALAEEYEAIKTPPKGKTQNKVSAWRRWGTADGAAPPIVKRLQGLAGSCQPAC